MKVRNSKLRHGHAPGHVRDTGQDVVQAFVHWNDSEPEIAREVRDRLRPARDYDFSRLHVAMELHGHHAGSLVQRTARLRS